MGMDIEQLRASQGRECHDASYRPTADSQAATGKSFRDLVRHTLPPAQPGHCQWCRRLLPAAGAEQVKPPHCYSDAELAALVPSGEVSERLLAHLRQGLASLFVSRCPDCLGCGQPDWTLENWVRKEVAEFHRLPEVSHPMLVS